MNVPFNTVQDKIKYALRDYTSVGRQSATNVGFMTDEQVYQLHPERYSFYMQMLDALQDPSSGVLDRVLSIENKSRYARDQLERTTKDVAKALRYLTLTMDKQSGGSDKGDPFANINPLPLNVSSMGTPMNQMNKVAAAASPVSLVTDDADVEHPGPSPDLVQNPPAPLIDLSDHLNEDQRKLFILHVITIMYMEMKYNTHFDNPSLDDVKTFKQSIKEKQEDPLLDQIDTIYEKDGSIADNILTYITNKNLLDDTLFQILSILTQAFKNQTITTHDKIFDLIDHAIYPIGRQLLVVSAFTAVDPNTINELFTDTKGYLEKNNINVDVDTYKHILDQIRNDLLSIQTFEKVREIIHDLQNESMQPSAVGSISHGLSDNGSADEEEHEDKEDKKKNETSHKTTPTTRETEQQTDQSIGTTPQEQLVSTINTLIAASSAPIKLKESTQSPSGQAGGSYYTNMLERVKKADDPDEKLKILDEVDTNPVYSPENEEVSMTDRVIFIAVTFMIRGLALFLIDWGINSQLITTFNRAFLYYTLIYFTLFMMWVLLVNAGKDTENVALKMAFYYVNWKANGIGRIVAHLAVQTFLIPIPFIVREPMQGAPDTATFEKRRAVYRVLSNFTIIVWVITSVIALRY